MSVKVMITVPEDFLRQIDQQAKDERRSRSEFLRQAARQYIEHSRRGKRPIDDPKVRAAFRSLDQLSSKWSGKWESAAVVRDMRNRRPR